jgi:hypothetical protein
MAGAALALVVQPAAAATGAGIQDHAARADVQAATTTAGTPATQARIVGVAWYADETPIPHARLRLRNISTGRVVAHTVASRSGRFEFAGAPPGLYAVELVDEHGNVLTVGHSFTLGKKDTVTTFVRLGTRVPWFNGFFANAAAAVASAAAAAGVTAIAPEAVRPVSATQ